MDAADADVDADEDVDAEAGVAASTTVVESIGDDECDAANEAVELVADRVGLLSMQFVSTRWATPRGVLGMVTTPPAARLACTRISAAV